MTFSTQWDKIYQKGNQLSIWPWSDLISYVNRHSKPDGDLYSVLELGFGVGANIPFFLSNGIDYYGTEGSITAVEDAKRRFDGQRLKLVCVDFTKIIPFDGPFHLVVDRCSLTLNSTNAIRKCIELVHDKMKPGAKFIGIDWFSTKHSDFSKGLEGDDPNTRYGFTEGQFLDVGKVHFSDEEHLFKLFSEFRFIAIEHKVVKNCISSIGQFGSYNFVCEKRKK